MKAVCTPDRVVLDLTVKEWERLQQAFAVVISDSQADEGNKTMAQAADIVYQIEGAVQKARGT